MALYGEELPKRAVFEDISQGPARGRDDRDEGLLVYVHVPFCRSKCRYCTFHSQVYGSQAVAWYLKTLVQEIELWGRRLGRPRVRTVYLGGGTPSLLRPMELDGVLGVLSKHMRIADGAEVSLEANPDSAVDVSWFRAVAGMGVNRLSLGVQSFDDARLRFLGRPHSAGMAVEAYRNARRAGLGNVSLDLMWGLPGQKLKDWLEELKYGVDLAPEHLSCYGLTLESGTPMHREHLEGGFELPAEKVQARMFLNGADYLESRGYLQYEISNFARMGFMSRHNLGYWSQADYLGLGPSAVSTLGRRRFRNPEYLDAYDAAVRGGFVGDDFEELTEATRLQEYVMLSLRTTRGMRLARFRKLAGFELTRGRPKLVQALYANNLIRVSGGRLRLTREGMLVSNAIVRAIAFDDA